MQQSTEKADAHVAGATTWHDTVAEGETQDHDSAGATQSQNPAEDRALHSVANPRRTNLGEDEPAVPTRRDPDRDE